MKKGILLFHPAGIGDCVIDISNLYQLALSKKNNYQFYYACNIYARPIIKSTELDKHLKIIYLNYPNRFSISDIVALYKLLSKIDIIVALAGMNLKKISYLKFILPKNIKLYGSLANLPYVRLKEILPLKKTFSGISGPFKYHRVLTNFYLFRNIGLVNDDLIIRNIDIEKVKDNLINKDRLIDLNFDYILVHTGYVTNRSNNKTLRIDAWKNILQKISHSFNMKIIIVGSSDERLNVKKIISKIDKKNILNFCGKTNLTETMYFISKARIIFAIDGLIGHIAAALNKKLVSFFGPGDYNDVCPINTNGYIISKILDCSPCYETPNYYNCPKNRICVDEIDSNLIVDCINEVLSGSNLSDKTRNGYRLTLIPNIAQLKSNLLLLNQ